MSDSQRSTHSSLCVKGAAAAPTASTANETSANSDPPSHTYLAGSGPHLWIAARAGDISVSNVDVSAPPSGYKDFSYLTPGVRGAGGSDLAVATKHDATASNNPSVFTSTLEQWAAVTIAIPGEVSISASSFPGSYSWWIYPIASQIESNSLIGFVEPSGRQTALQLDSEGNYAASAQLYNSYGVDEHNAPSITQLSDSSLLWSWAGHNDESKILYYKSDSFSEEPATPVALSTSDVATYAQVLTRDSEVYWLYRVGNKAWSLRFSNDDADTWSSEIPFLGDAASEQMYITTRKVDADTIRVLVTNNGGTANNHFWVLMVDLTDGDVFSGSGSLGNIDGTSLPAARTELTSIYDASAGRGIRLLDVNSTATAFVYADYDLDDSPEECMYRIARLTGADPFDAGDWTHSDIVACGSAFYAASHYFGGVVFANESHSGLRLYLSREDTGTWFIERYDSALGDGSDWVATELDSSSDFLLRPISPVGAAGSFPVYWQQGPSYVTYEDYDLRVVAP
jgi:hypothetical protein